MNSNAIVLRHCNTPTKNFWKSNMGWDSDSDDAVDIDAQLAAKNAAKKTYAISALGV